AEHFDVRAAAVTRSGDDVGRAVPVHVADRDADATAEVRVVCEERHEQPAAVTAKHLDVRAATLAGPGDDVGTAVAMEVAGGYVPAAAESRGVGEESEQSPPAGSAECPDVRAAAVAGAGDDVGRAVAVDIADRHTHPTAEGRVVSEVAADCSDER